MDTSEFLKLKMIAIAGAAEALRIKEKNPRASESEIVQQISDKAEKIIERIDAEI